MPPPKAQASAPEPDRALRTFRHHFAFRCACSGSRYPTREHVLQQAASGGATCGACGDRADLREALRHFNALGQLEALFGLDVFVFSKDIPETTIHQVIVIAPEVELPYKATLVYANVTPECATFEEAPSLLAPQEFHHPWSMYMRFHVPPGPARRLNILMAVRPIEGMAESLEMALQAVDAFHRGRLPLAGLLLTAAAEAILRPLSESVYAARSVRLPSDLGFAALLERARILFEPSLGAQFVGNLKALAKDARNPSAHGRAVKLERDHVAMWMVDLAVLFEWARSARSQLATGGAPV